MSWFDHRPTLDLGALSCLGAVVVRGLSSKAYQHDHAERPQGQQRALDQCAKHQLNGKHLRCCFVSLFMDSVGFCGVC